MPTQAGRRLAKRARQLLGDYEQVLDMAKEDKDAPLYGLLRVTAPSLFGRWHIAPLISSFLNAHAGVRVELVLTNRNLDLVEEGLDIAVRIGPLTESGLIARRVGQVSRVLTASPRYIARCGRPRTPKDLAKHDVVFVSVPASSNEWRFRRAGREQVARLTPRFMVTEVEAALQVARAGGGIARSLSYQVADDLASGVLVRLLQEFEPPAWPVHLVLPTTRHMPRTVRAFVDQAVSSLTRLRVIHE
jgi:DNA-binding transcriptional LysR family regulator